MKNQKKRNKITFEIHEYGLMLTLVLLCLQIAKVFAPSIMLTLSPLFLSYFIEYVLMIWIFGKELRKERGKRR